MARTDVGVTTEGTAQNPEQPQQSWAITCRRDGVAVIFNPASGTLDPKLRRTTIQRLLDAAGLTCEMVETEPDRGAESLAREALAKGLERVLISGGDGSIMEAAQVLAGSDTALGVLPGGTGNLLALNMGIPTDYEHAMRLALEAEPRKVDVGRANGKVFLILAGMGADARMIREAGRDAKRRLGVLAYFLAALRNMRRQRVRYRITIDGRSIRRRAQTVMVANLGRITAGLELVPGADPYDGELEVVILRTRGFRDVLILSWQALTGQPRHRRLQEIRRGRRILIEARRPQPVELDGNDAGVSRRLQVHVEAGALKLLCPAPGEARMPTPAGVASTVTQQPTWPPLAAGLLVGAVTYALQKPGRKQGIRVGRAAVAGLAVGSTLVSIALILRQQSSPPPAHFPAAQP